MWVSKHTVNIKRFLIVCVLVCNSRIYVNNCKKGKEILEAKPIKKNSGEKAKHLLLLGWIFFYSFFILNASTIDSVVLSYMGCSSVIQNQECFKLSRKYFKYLFCP